LARQPGRMRARYLRVLLFFGPVVAGVLWWDVFLAHLGLRRLARRTAPGRYQRVARRFRMLATRLGGVWIKVGQFLSARVDVLPETITSELANLQDEVAPESFEAMRGVIEAEFRAPLGQVFAAFEAEPLASASLGQVHRARLATGEAVVVKVQRPEIHEILRVDLAALQTVIGWLKRYRPIAKRADLDALLAEFSRTLWEEVDYLAEAENARRFALMFADEPTLRVPAVHAAQTTLRVLTLEDVYAIKITDYAAIEAAGVDRAEVADRLFRTYLRQIFVEGFFHADPHPGNLFVQPLADGGWRLVFVDFGMVGRLSPQAKQGLRDMAVGVGTRNFDRLMTAYQELGVLLPEANIDRLRQAEAAVFDRFWGKSMRELTHLDRREMHRFAMQFRDLLFEMPFQIPTDLIFLGRCVSILSGMCTGLNPEFNLFGGLAPFAQQLLEGEGGDWLSTLLDWLVEQGRLLAAVPARVDAVLSKIERGEFSVVAHASPDLERRLAALTRSINRLVASVVFAALLLVGSLLYTNGDHLVGGIGLGLAALTLIWVLRG
jgi:predicted unusual protein kinase regulating ubiquinone biosynthesis (AarF/ABC1/UbiB family)